MRLCLLDLLHGLLSHQHVLQFPTCRLIAQIGNRLTSGHGSDLDDGQTGCELVSALVGLGSLRLSGENIPAQVGFGGEGSCKTDHLGSTGGNSFGHGVSGLQWKPVINFLHTQIPKQYCETHPEATSDTKDGLLQRRPNLLSKLDKVRLSLLRRVPLVLESHALVGAAGKFDEVETRCFQLLTQEFALVTGEATFRETVDATKKRSEREQEYKKSGDTDSELFNFILRMNLEVSTRFLISSMIRKTIRLLFSRGPP
jgi:hypothetical protein